MYLYFNRNGVLKEIINDTALRQGNDNYNAIYCYFEDITYLGKEFWFRYKLSDGTLFPRVETTIKITKEIPFDNKRDLKYFKYFKSYSFIVIPTSFVAYETQYNALASAGNVSCDVEIVDNNTILTSGLITFNVAESTDGSNFIQAEEYVSLAQFDYLLRKCANNVSSFNFTDETTLEEIDELNKPVIIFVYNGKSYIGAVKHDSTYSFEFECLDNSARYENLSTENITLEQAIVESNRQDFIKTIYCEETTTIDDLYDVVGNKTAVLYFRGSSYIGNLSHGGPGYFFEYEDTNGSQRYSNSSGSLDTISGSSLVNQMISSTYSIPYATEKWTKSNFVKVITLESTTTLENILEWQTQYSSLLFKYGESVYSGRVLLTGIPGTAYMFEFESSPGVNRYSGFANSDSLTIGEIFTSTYENNYLTLKNGVGVVDILSTDTLQEAYAKLSANTYPVIVRINSVYYFGSINSIGDDEYIFEFESASSYVRYFGQSDGSTLISTCFSSEFRDDYATESNLTNYTAPKETATYTGSVGAYRYYYQFASNGTYVLQLAINRDTSVLYQLGIITIDDDNVSYVIGNNDYKAVIDVANHTIRVYSNGVEFDDNDYTEDCYLYIKHIH